MQVSTSIHDSLSFRRGLLTILLVMALAVPASASENTLRIHYPDFWPFFTRTDEGRMTGFFYEIVSSALTRMGIQSSWESYPWSRCQAQVRSGEADAMITVPTPERLRYSNTHDTPFYLKKLVIFTYKDHPALPRIREIMSIKDIMALNLSVINLRRQRLE